MIAAADPAVDLADQETAIATTAGLLTARNRATSRGQQDPREAQRPEAELRPQRESSLAAEAAPTREAASEALRPDIELPGALRWLRRRTGLVRAGLAAAIGLLPGLLAGCTPTVTSVRSALGAEIALVCLRLELAPLLGELPPPLGFGRRPARRRPSPTALQQEAGPDPPADVR
jgi:hypothetical protein